MSNGRKRSSSIWLHSRRSWAGAIKVLRHLWCNLRRHWRWAFLRKSSISAEWTKNRSNRCVRTIGSSLEALLVTSLGLTSLLLATTRSRVPFKLPRTFIGPNYSRGRPNCRWIVKSCAIKRFMIRRMIIQPNIGRPTSVTHLTRSTNIQENIALGNSLMICSKKIKTSLRCQLETVLRNTNITFKFRIRWIRQRLMNQVRAKVDISRRCALQIRSLILHTRRWAELAHQPWTHSRTPCFLPSAETSKTTMRRQVPPLITGKKSFLMFQFSSRVSIREEAPNFTMSDLRWACLVLLSADRMPLKVSGHPTSAIKGPENFITHMKVRCHSFRNLVKIWLPCVISLSPTINLLGKSRTTCSRIPWWKNLAEST